MIEEVTFLKISEDNQDLYSKIKDSKHKNLPQKTMTINYANIFMVCLVLGYKNKTRIILERARESIPYSVIERQNNVNSIIIKTVAMKETNDLKVLENPKEFAKIAEEYANGGAEILKSLLKSDYLAIINYFLEEMYSWSFSEIN